MLKIYHDFDWAGLSPLQPPVKAQNSNLHFVANYLNPEEPTLGDFSGLPAREAVGVVDDTKVGADLHLLAVLDVLDDQVLLASASAHTITMI